MKLAPAVILLIIVLIVTAMSGCFSPPRKITATVGPEVSVGPTAGLTVTPRPTPIVVHPTVTVVGDTTSIAGSRDGMAMDFRLGQGIYVVTWSGSGTHLSLSLSDPNGNGLTDMSKGITSGSRLLVVDGGKVNPGNFNLMATSDGDWSVTIKKPDTSSAGTLPVTMSGSEEGGAVSAPFKALAGDIKISYTFSRTPYADGHVYIYNLATGASFYTRPMTSGSEVGQSMSEVPVDGVYIAQADIAPGGSYGEITISQ